MHPPSLEESDSYHPCEQVATEQNAHQIQVPLRSPSQQPADANVQLLVLPVDEAATKWCWANRAVAPEAGDVVRYSSNGSLEVWPECVFVDAGAWAGPASAVWRELLPLLERLSC